MEKSVEQMTGKLTFLPTQMGILSSGLYQEKCGAIPVLNSTQVRVFFSVSMEEREVNEDNEYFIHFVRQVHVHKQQKLKDTLVKGVEIGKSKANCQ